MNATMPASEAEPSLKDYSVLFVEDEKEARETLTRFFRRRMANVWVAQDGLEGVESYRANQPDMVIADIRMPRMDGLAMCRAIRAMDERVPLILTTACREPEEILDAIDLGVSKYLLKPIPRKALLDTLREQARILGLRRYFRDWKNHQEWEQQLAASYLEQMMALPTPHEMEGIRCWQQTKDGVSGDFFCFHRHAQRGLYLLFADACGHGLPALLPAAQLPHTFRHLAAEGHLLPRIAGRLNQFLIDQHIPSHFVAAILIRIDPEEGRLEVINCSVPPAVLADEEGDVLRRFDSLNTALGVSDGDAFQVLMDTFECRVAARLYLASDGLTELVDEQTLEGLWRAPGESRFEALSATALGLCEKGHADDATLVEVNLTPSFFQGKTEAAPRHSVLLLETEPLSRETLSRILLPRAGTLHAARSIQEAWSLLQQHHPGLLILNLSLPDREGVDFIRRIRDRDAEIPLIVTSACHDIEGVLSVLDAGATRYLPRPLDPRKLLETMEYLLRQGEITRKRKLFSLIFDHSPQARMIANMDARILAVNETFTRITGYRADEVLGRKTNLLSSGLHEEAFYREMWRGLREHGLWSGEILNRRKNGQIYREWLRISRLENPDSDASCFYAAEFTELAEQKALEENLAYLAYYDGLTGLPNRKLLLDRMGQTIRNSQRTESGFAVFFLDLDHFKDVNDTLGHAAGDDLLRCVAERMGAVLRDSDTLARPGGDEFVLIAASCADPEAASILADKMLQALHEPIPAGGQSFQAGVSIGIALFPRDGLTSEVLLRAADSAMYQAKKAGRSTCRFFQADGTGGSTRAS